MTTVQIKGADELRRRLMRAGDTLLPSIAAAVEQQARAIQARALETVPVDEGTLAASAFVETRVDGPNVSATTGYAAPYAAFVHEGMHNGTHIAAPKWLERAAAAQESSFAAGVAVGVKDGLQKLRK